MFIETIGIRSTAHEQYFMLVEANKIPRNISSKISGLIYFKENDLVFNNVTDHTENMSTLYNRSKALLNLALQSKLIDIYVSDVCVDVADYEINRVGRIIGDYRVKHNI